LPRVTGPRFSLPIVLVTVSARRSLFPSPIPLPKFLSTPTPIGIPGHRSRTRHLPIPAPIRTQSPLIPRFLPPSAAPPWATPRSGGPG
jgi:hypothetical protein